MRVNLDKARRTEIERRGQFPERLLLYLPCHQFACVFNRNLMQINARGMTGAVISVTEAYNDKYLFLQPYSAA